MLINLNRRQHEPELMDNPELEENTMRDVLSDINRVNRLLNGHEPLIDWLIKDIQRKNLPQVSILDAGCGEGEFLRILWRRLNALKIECSLIGVDLNEKSLNLAKKLTNTSYSIQYFRHDLFHPLPARLRADYVISNLTLHHFRDDELLTVTANLLRGAKEATVIFDLHRCKRSYYLFKIFSAIFITTKIAVHDGLVSIKSGFKRTELEELSGRFTKAKCDVKWKWAFRYLMVLKPLNP